MDRLFSDFAQDYPAWGAVGALLWPPINMWEENDNFMLEAETPGLKMDQLEITCQGRDLTLRGERQDPGDSQEMYQRRERFTGGFVRSLSLPADIDAAKIRATLDDGILRLAIPKAESAKPRRIEVKTSQRAAPAVEPAKTAGQ
jgi:HSP20 family protein